jgi:methylated-DNA-[protein]-cysteine S-methyltransferase
VLAPVETSSFRRACWDALLDIPYGAVATYAEVARAVGRPLAARAVGNANHANPWPILIPCHRVVARNGLGGYGGGVDVKEYLLELERRLITP